jgi:hypothetical protein
MTKFFGLYAKHPCIEYLTKMGLHECVEDKLNGYYTYGAINWNGKSIEKVLKLTKNQFKAIKNSGAEIDMQLLKLYQITLSEGTNLSPEEINKIKRDFSFVSMKDLDPVRKFSTLSKVHSFACNQYEINRSLKERHYFDIRDVMIGYKDYLKDCMTLEMDMKSENVLFPKNLHNAHQNTIKQIKIQATAHLEAKIKKNGGIAREKICLPGRRISDPSSEINSRTYRGREGPESLRRNICRQLRERPDNYSFYKEDSAT